MVEYLNIVMHMLLKFFFIKDTFPFQTTVAIWNDNDKVKIGMNA